MKRILRALLALLLLGVSAAAQPLPEEAAKALRQAQTVTQEALSSYPRYHPDQPLFKEAIALGRRAVYLAPDDPRPLRFLAEVYTVTDFYGPAFQTWQRFLRAGGSLDEASRNPFAETGNKLGYARYEQGNLKGALSAYRAVTRQVPENLRAQRWTGRILLEQGNPKAARGYWQRVVNAQPGDAGAAYFLALSEAGVQHGLEAARAFYEGVRHYEADRPQQAQRAFVQATEADPSYAEAWGYRGRIAFEAGRFARAAEAYREASRLEPESDAYRYFLRQAQRRLGAD